MREVGDRLELAEIVRARGRLHDEGEPGPVEDLRSLHRVSPGATHLPEAVVTIGIERIEGERQPPRSGLRQAPRHVLRDAHAVGADDDPESALRRAPDDLEDVAPQERLAARQDRQAFRRERGDLVDDPEAFLGAELAPIGEVLRADQRRAAGVEIAVLAGEVAAVGEVPGDDVGPGEPCSRDRSSLGESFGSQHAHMPKKSRAASRIFSSTSRAPLSRANFSMPVRAMGRTNAGMFASRASAAAVHRTGIGSAAWPGRASLVRRNHRGERALAARRRSTRSRARRVGTDPHAE